MVPLGAIVGIMLMIFSGISCFTGMQHLGPALDEFAGDLGYDQDLGGHGMRYVAAVYIIIALIYLPVLWRGMVVEARNCGSRVCDLPCSDTCPAGCAACLTGAWTGFVGLLLYICVLLAIPVFAIVEAYYLLFGASRGSAALTSPPLD